MPRVVVIDNYDSFVYNLVQYLGELGAEPAVYRPDQITLDGIAELRPDALLISPGPGRPEDATLALGVLGRFAGPRGGARTVPILGVCLGHQCIGQFYGGDVVRAPAVVHGKTSLIHHRGQGVLAGLADPFEATRYHSLLVDRDSLPASLEIIAETNDGLIMGLRHRDLAVEGVQFHPESILTTDGRKMLATFLAQAAAPVGR